MKITLVAIHQISMETRVPIHRCLGILTLSSALKSVNIDVEILDLANYSITAFSDYKQIMEEIVGKILSTKPDLLGLSTMSNNIVMALDVCRKVKEMNPMTKTILGGPGASFSAGNIMSLFEDVDFIIRGESDFALPMLVNQMIQGEDFTNIKGVVHRNGVKILDNGWPDPIKDLNSLPIPDYAVCEEDENSDEPVTLEVGRGCPFACIFCSTSSFFKRRFRVKSVERVIEEIRVIQKKFRHKRIKLNHDLLTFNRDYMFSLCDGLVLIETPIAWSCSARLDTLDEEILKKMRQAGCDSIYLGIETVSDRLQSRINKRLDLTNIDEILRVAADLGFRITLSFVVGFPEEKIADIVELWEFVIHAKSIHPLNILIQIHSLVPEPGSQLFETMKENLEYDDYGGPGHSDFPPISWTELRTMIKTHPDIFPNYYYINTPSMKRENIIRQVYLGQIVDSLSTCSIQFAYSILGNKLAQRLIDKLEEIEIPELKWPEIDYREMMESIRDLVIELLRDDNNNELLYDAIVEAEIAFAEVARRKPDHSKFIETWYHPIEHMNRIMGHDYNPNKLDKQPRTIFIFWNEETDAIAYTELSFEIAELRRQIKRKEKE